MEGTPIKCPVCGADVVSNWNCCHNCGFEIHILPDNANVSIKTYEDIRINTAKRQLQIGSQKNEDLINAKDAEIKKKDEEIKQKDADIESQVQLVVQKDQQLQSMTQELAALEAALQQKTSQVEQLNKQMAIYASYHAPEIVERLQKQISELKERLSQQQSGGTSHAAVSYLIQFDGDAAQNIYALAEGSNSFGSAPTKAGHKQVLMGDLRSEHFTILVKVDQVGSRRKVSFTVEPKQGGITIDNPYEQPRKSGTHNLEKNSDLFAGGLRFRLLPNKDFK